jgi:uncharacterized membrane protein
MSNSELNTNSNTVAKLPLLAAVVALIGLFDSVYLTIKHVTAEIVPCGEGFDCGAVLSSQYSEMFGIPLAVWGAIAYFTAFSLAILAAFGYRNLWNLFTIQVTLMAISSAYFVYLQAFVIKAYCQFCLISAGVCLTLFAIAMISRFVKR